MADNRAIADRQTQWLRGVLDLAVLATLKSAGTSYGYALIQSLTEAGILDLKGGTIYPLLSRLEQEGLVSSAWQAGDGGPGRKYFTITATGREVLVRSAAGWTDFSARIGSILRSALSDGGQ
ncbi:MAG: PadR family transcriptional regulator [Dermatophilaceae bacterium]